MTPVISSYRMIAVKLKPSDHKHVEIICTFGASQSFSIVGFHRKLHLGRLSSTLPKPHTLLKSEEAIKRICDKVSATV